MKHPAKKKATKKRKVTARKVKVLHIEKVDTDKHVVHLEIEGAPEVPNVPIPAEPLDLTVHTAENHGLIAWLKSLW